MKQHEPPDRSPLLSWLMFPVGAEVGFSSAGAGALGSAALLSLTTLLPAQVVGTDIAFGFVVSLIGSGAHWFSHASNPSLLLHLIEGGVAGAVVGTILSTRIPRRPLRFALWVWLLILGGQFLFNSYHVWAATRSGKPASRDSPERLMCRAAAAAQTNSEPCSLARKVRALRRSQIARLQRTVTHHDALQHHTRIDRPYLQRVISGFRNRQRNRHAPHAIAHRLLPVLLGVVLQLIDYRPRPLID